jgi:chemotaxis protein MotB
VKGTRSSARLGAAVLLAALLAGPAPASAQQAAPADAAQVEALRAAVRTLTAETDGLREQLRGSERGIAERDAALNAARKDLAARDARLRALETDLSADAGRAAALEAELASARVEVANKAGELQALKEQAETVAATAAGLELRNREGDAALEQAQAQLAELRARLLAARNDLGAAELRLAAARKENEALAEAGRELVAAQRGSAERARELEAEVAAQAEELRNLREQAEVVAATAAALELRGQESDAALEEARARAAERDARIEAMRAELLAARNDLGAAELQLTAARKENEALAEAGRELVAAQAALEGQLAAAETATARRQERGERRLDELTAHRDAFFARLSEELGPGSGVEIEGERFVFPADVAFESGSARLTPRARARVVEIGGALAAAGAAIPGEADWVIRVDGHTDRQPVADGTFDSNRELSVARAVAVVEALAEAGLPPERLVAAGFGESRPRDPGGTPEAYRRNRRIELRLDEY